MNSSVSGTVKSCLWSKRKAACGWWRGEAGGGGGVSALTCGGTTTGSPPFPFHSEYWQKTKCDSDGGRPVACFIATRMVTCKLIVITDSAVPLKSHDEN